MSVFARAIFFNTELRSGLLKAWLSKDTEVKIYFNHGTDLELALIALRNMIKKSKLVFLEEKDKSFVMANGSRVTLMMKS